MNNLHDDEVAIVIVGGNIIGWSFAYAIKMSSPTTNVSVIELPKKLCSSSIFSTIETTLPSSVDFHQSIGVSQTELCQYVPTSFTLGEVYKGFSNHQRNEFFCPYSDHGFILNGIEFLDSFMWSKQSGQTNRFEDYSINKHAATLGKFSQPSKDPSSLYSLLSHGLTLDAPKYNQFLKNKAVNIGVEVRNAQSVELVETKIGHSSVEFKTKDKSNNRKQADLVIDCSLNGLPEKKASKQITLPKSNPLQYVVIEAIVPATMANTPFTINKSLLGIRGGWKQVQYLPEKEQHLFYLPNETPDSDILNIIWQNLDKYVKPSSVQLVYRHKIDLNTSECEPAWQGNVIKMQGHKLKRSGVFIPKISMIHLQIQQFLKLFPKKQTLDVCADYFNRMAQLSDTQNSIYHDFLTLIIQERLKEVWQSLFVEDIDKRLFHRLLLYKARGKIDDQEGEVFSHQHWQAILMGLGYEPQDFDPLAMNVDQKFMVQELEKIKQTLYRAACQLPTLNEYLAINKQ